MWKFEKRTDDNVPNSTSAPSYSLRNYTVEKWPEGVDMFKPTWNKRKLEAIRSKMVHFVFVNEKFHMIFETEFGISDLGDLGMLSMKICV